jgi:hypothetical protein
VGRVATLAIRTACVALAAGVVACALPACSQGEGEGRITGTLDVPSCWSGGFELSPDFFGAVPYRGGLQLRIQSGSDYQNFSDGLSILLYDIAQIRPDPARGFPGRYRQPLAVDLPPAVTPPGVPVEVRPDPALVGMTLYLQRSCRTQNVSLNVAEQVAIPDDGSCSAGAVMGADPQQGCAPDRESPAGVGTGRSFIAFTSVANGRLDEETAAERLTAGCFDVYLADPRDGQPASGGGPVGVPPRCRGHIKGTFSFFFERGRPAQPFP